MMNWLFLSRGPSRGAALAITVLAVIAAISCQPLQPGSEVKPVPAPNFTLPDIDGRAVSLSDHKGKVVLIDFWATWCIPCRMEMPMLQALHNEFREKGFEVIGISVDENPSKVVPSFIKDVGLNYTNLLGNEEIARLYGPIEGIPTFVLIDREGKIRRRGTGGRPREAFEKWIMELLQETPKRPDV